MLRSPSGTTASAAFALLVEACAGCRPSAPADPLVAAQDFPARSADGRWTLSVVRDDEPEARSYRIRILDPVTGACQVMSTERFRLRDRFVAAWDDAGTAWVYSGDVGARFWRQGADGAWGEYRAVCTRAPQRMIDLAPSLARHPPPPDCQAGARPETIAGDGLFAPRGPSMDVVRPAAPCR